MADEFLDIPFNFRAPQDLQILSSSGQSILNAVQILAPLDDNVIREHLETVRSRNGVGSWNLPGPQGEAINVVQHLADADIYWWLAAVRSHSMWTFLCKLSPSSLTSCVKLRRCGCERIS